MRERPENEENEGGGDDLHGRVINNVKQRMTPHVQVSILHHISMTPSTSRDDTACHYRALLQADLSNMAKVVPLHQGRPEP